MKKSGRSPTGHRLNSAVLLLLLLALSVALAWISSRFDEPFDWTRNNRHSLSETSIRTLNNIHGPLVITAYAREQRELREAIREYIAVYQRSKPDIELHFRNPDAVPDEVRNLGISINGELVLQYQGRREHVRNADENTFANALLRLSRQEQNWIVFVEGHGERHPFGKANHDLGEWVTRLRTRGYTVQALNTAEVGAIPDNTSVLVLAGPRVPLLPAEMQLLLDYLHNGGNLLWLADPETAGHLAPVAELLSLDIPAGMVIDVAGRLIGLDDPTITMVTSSLYGDHPALAGFNYTTLFPGAAALFNLDSGNWSATPLLTSGDHTWLKTEIHNEELQFDETGDLRGPLVIGIGLEQKTETNNDRPRRQRVIVIGDGDFLSNTFIGNAGNLELGVRIMDWLSNVDDHIDIPPRIAADRHLVMSPITMGIIGIFFLFVLPVLFAAAGFIIWRQRRNS